MHPIERLRYVARASGADQRLLVRETAGALRGLGVEPAGLVTSCRRIVERHPASGPLWWLCATVLTSPDPLAAARECVRLVEDDHTGRWLYDAIPEDSTVAVLGWPDIVSDVLVRRGDIRVLAIEAHNETNGLVRRLDRADVDYAEVSVSGLGAAVSNADLVLLEAAAIGPDAALCVGGSHAAAAVAYCSEIPVWMVAGVGRSLPQPMWDGLVGALADRGEPWELDDDIVPLSMVSHILGPDGIGECGGTIAVFDAPIAYELIPRGTS